MEIRTSIRLPSELADKIKASGKEDGRAWTSQLVQLAKEALAARQK